MSSVLLWKRYIDAIESGDKERASALWMEYLRAKESEQRQAGVIA